MNGSMYYEPKSKQAVKNDETDYVSQVPPALRIERASTATNLMRGGE
jgi:hypothetical protein